MPEDYADTLTERATAALDDAHGAHRAAMQFVDTPADRAEHARRAHELAAYAETLLRIAREGVPSADSAAPVPATITVSHDGAVAVIRVKVGSRGAENAVSVSDVERSQAGAAFVARCVVRECLYSLGCPMDGRAHAAVERAADAIVRGESVEVEL